jgi:hypothetical protein
MTLTGENLGLRGYVLFVPTKQNIDQRVIKIRYSMQLSHSHQVITFNQPEGLGDDLLLVAVIGGQTSAVITNSVTDAFGEISGGIAQLPSSAAPLFSFDKPEVTNHYNAAKSPAFCTPRVELYKINNKTFVNRTVYPAYPGCFPTQPDDAYVVVIRAETLAHHQLFRVLVSLSAAKCATLHLAITIPFLALHLSAWVTGTKFL